MPHNNSRSSYQRRAQRALLIEAQDGVCGCGCGGAMQPDAPSMHDDFPTLDHQQPAARGGQHHLRNLIAVRRACNQRRGVKPASPAALEMLAAVQGRLAQLLAEKPFKARVREIRLDAERRRA